MEREKLFISIILFILIISSINPLKNFLTKKILEIYLTNLTEFPTRIENVNYEIFKGNLTLNNIKIFNSKEYDYLYALTIKYIKFDNISFSKKNVNSFYINEANLFLEHKNKTTNLSKLFNNIKKNSLNNKAIIKNKIKDNKDNSFLNDLNKLSLNFISVRDSYIVLIHKSIPRNYIYIPLEDYIQSKKSISSLTELLNAYLNLTVNKIKDANRFKDLKYIFPKLNDQIKKIEKELDEFEKIQ